MNKAELQGLIISRIKVPAGVYSVETCFDGLVIPSNTILNLVDVTLKSVPVTGLVNTLISICSASNVTVIGGTLQGNNYGDTVGAYISGSSHVRFVGTTFINFDTYGARVHHKSSNVTFENCTFINNQESGLAVTGCKGLVVSCCTFSDNGGRSTSCGIDIDPAEGDSVMNTRVVGCTFTNNLGPAISAGVNHKSIEHSLCEKLVIKECRFEGNGGGVYCQYVKWVHLTCCEFVRNAFCSIALSNSDICDIVSNTLVRNGCESESYGSPTIRLNGCDDLYVTRNVVSSNVGNGIVFTASTGIDCSRNTISNIKCGQTAHDYSGVLIQAGCNGTLAGNRIANNVGYGLKCLGSRVQLLSNTTENNTLTDKVLQWSSSGVY